MHVNLHLNLLQLEQHRFSLKSKFIAISHKEEESHDSTVTTTCPSISVASQKRNLEEKICRGTLQHRSAVVKHLKEELKWAERQHFLP